MSSDTLILDEAPNGRFVDDEVFILQRREQVVRLRAQRKSVSQIARLTDSNVATVTEDLKWVRQDWLRRIARNKTIWMAEALEAWENLISVAWEDYFGTGETVESQNAKGSGRRRKKKDPRLLGVISDALKQKCAILGLGDKAAIDRVDEVLGKKMPKLLVVRDRAQVENLVDITKLIELDIRGPKSADDKLRKKKPADENAPIDGDSPAEDSIPADDVTL